MFAEIHVERGRIRAILPCTTGTVIRTETDTWDFPGCHVLPGFVDAHCHLLGLGQRLTTVDLSSCRSAEEAADLIASKMPATGWVQAMGWNHEHWKNSALPTAAILDERVGNRSVVARRIDGHAIWCSSAALEAAGIGPRTIDPQGGFIVRDATGNPTGVLVDAATAAIEAVLPQPSREELEQLYLLAANACAEHGITEVHDMDVAPAWLEALRPLAERGALAVRVQAFVRGTGDAWDIHGLLPAGGEMLRLAGIKFFADGALGSRGAWLLSPYSDAPLTTGLPFYTTEDLYAACEKVVEAGWPSIAIHAIGDAAVRQVLDVYERLRQHPTGADCILRIEHAQHVHPDDVHRFHTLGVIASVQPTHCCSDASMALARVGPERAGWAYRWASFTTSGCQVVGGSDFPIEPVGVLRGIDAFVRRIPGVTASDSTRQQERLTIDQALDAMCCSPHMAADVDYRRGKLAVSYDADLVIVDRDIRSLDPAEIMNTHIMATFMGGRCRFLRRPA
jgi:hypothetical protein